MKYCTYIIELIGDIEVVNILDKFVERKQPSLSDARITARAIKQIFGNSVGIKIVVRQISVSRGSSYTLAPTGPV